MPVIRFVREGRDVSCYPGENLREVALREGVEIYGLKGKLGNCGGCGQCITCFVAVEEPTFSAATLTPRTAVEERKLLKRPGNWRLACQALVQRSLIVVTRPQVALPDGDRLLAEAQQQPLPEGPTSWPVVEVPAEDEGEEEGATTTTTGEGLPEASGNGDTVR